MLMKINIPRAAVAIMLTLFCLMALGFDHTLSAQGKRALGPYTLETGGMVTGNDGNYSATTIGSTGMTGNSTLVLKYSVSGTSVNGGDFTIEAETGDTISGQFTGSTTGVNAAGYEMMACTWTASSGTGKFKNVSGSGTMNLLLKPSAGIVHADFLGSISF
jgi:hypothetical protein